MADDLPNVVPNDALDHLARKRFWITGVLSERLLGEARGILLRAVETGETLADTQQALRDLFEPYVGREGVTVDGRVVTAARLETIVRTNVTDAFNAGRLVGAREAGELLTGMEYSAVLDSRTTEVCRRLDGKVILKDDPALDSLKPPRHFNCRSVLVPVTIETEVADEDVLTKTEAATGLELSGKGFGGPTAKRRKPPAPRRPKAEPAVSAERLDRSAREEVRERGASDGYEHMVLIDPRAGTVVDRNTSGKRGAVSFTPAMIEAMSRKQNRLVGVHNYPSGTSLSQMDLAAVDGYPGLAEVVAVGANGSVYRAREVKRKIRAVYDGASDAVRILLQRAITEGKLPIEAASMLHAHAVNTALGRGGVMTYEAELSRDMQRLLTAHGAIVEEAIEAGASVVAAQSKPRRRRR